MKNVLSKNCSLVQGRAREESRETLSAILSRRAESLKVLVIKAFYEAPGSPSAVFFPSWTCSALKHVTSCLEINECQCGLTWESGVSALCGCQLGDGSQRGTRHTVCRRRAVNKAPLEPGSCSVGEQTQDMVLLIRQNIKMQSRLEQLFGLFSLTHHCDDRITRKSPSPAVRPRILYICTWGTDSITQQLHPEPKWPISDRLTGSV